MSAFGGKADISRYCPNDRDECTPFCNGPVDVNCSPIVTPPSSRFCPWSTLRPPHYAVRGSGEPIFCNGPVDVNCSPIVTPPSSRFCPWSTLRPPHYAVRGSGEPI